MEAEYQSQPYEEIDRHEVTDFGRYGERVYTYPGMAFEETYCARCDKCVGPVEAADPETGHSREGWRDCFEGPIGIVCEPCADALNAVAEIEAVLDQYTRQRGLDPEKIYGIFSSPLDRIATLRVSHLRLLLAMAGFPQNADPEPLSASESDATPIPVATEPATIVMSASGNLTYDLGGE